MITDARPRREGLIESLLLYAVLFMPALVAAKQAGPGLNDPSWHLSYWILSLPQAVFLLWGLQRRGVLVARGGGAPGFSVALRSPALALGALGLGWVALILLAIPSMMGLGEAVEWKSLPYSFSRVGLLPMAIITSFITGYREESFFRGWLQSDLGEAGFGGWTAVILSALLFGVLHAWEGWRGIIATTVVGLLFAWRYAKKRDLHEIALAHGIYNSIAMALSLLASPPSAG